MGRAAVAHHPGCAHAVRSAAAHGDRGGAGVRPHGPQPSADDRAGAWRRAFDHGRGLTHGTLDRHRNGVAIPGPSNARPGFAGIRAIVLPTGLSVLVLLGWQAFVTLGHVPPVILPSPLATMGYIVEHCGHPAQQAVPTTVEFHRGLLAGDRSGRVARDPDHLLPSGARGAVSEIVFFQLIPKIALAPLFIIWLGIGAQSRIAFSVFIAFFPVVIATTGRVPERRSRAWCGSAAR